MRHSRPSGHCSHMQVERERARERQRESERESLQALEAADGAESLHHANEQSVNK